MIGQRASDFWRVGLVPAPIATLTSAASLAAQRPAISWMPDPGPWRYLADPFGVVRGAVVHVFVEAFDYRTKHAVIEHHEFGADRTWRGGTTALMRPYHLSYPFIVEEGGEVFMVPESFRANEIALYRAQRFPGEWEREAVLLPGVAGAEPSLLRYRDRWWMFFTIVGSRGRDQRELHVAYADALTGPWHLYARNPVIDDRTGARPGGSPFVAGNGDVVLPVQDCSDTYGGALRFVRFAVLEPDFVLPELLPARLTGADASATHRDGLHTLSACGSATLLDVKRIDYSWTRFAIDLRRRLDRMRKRTAVATC